MWQPDRVASEVAERPWLTDRQVRGVAVLAAAACAAGTVPALAGPGTPAGAAGVVVVVAAVAAGWFAALWPVHGRGPRVGWRVGYHLVLLGLLTALVAISPWFMIASWTAFVVAFILFPARWAFGAAAAGGVALTVAQERSAVPSPTTTPLFLASLVVPLLVGGWFLGRESESRRQLIGELGAANEALEGALAANADLQQRIVAQAREAGVQQERQRVAREIHDTLAQTLSAITAQLEVGVGSDGPGDRLVERARLARDLAREGLAEARRSVGALTPRPLVRADLPAALRQLAGEWSGRSGVAATVRCDDDLPPLPPEAGAALFRIAQSALANVAEHAAAGRVRLTLSGSGTEVVLDVRDDGVGFDAGASRRPAAGRGFGLAASEQRMAELGGHLRVETAPGAGTALRAVLPIGGEVPG